MKCIMNHWHCNLTYKCADIMTPLWILMGATVVNWEPLEALANNIALLAKGDQVKHIIEGKTEGFTLHLPGKVYGQ